MSDVPYYPCLVRNCESKLKKGDGISLDGFSFNKRQKIEEWLGSLKTGTPTNYICVCRKHFKDENHRKTSTEISNFINNCTLKYLNSLQYKRKCNSFENESPSSSKNECKPQIDQKQPDNLTDKKLNFLRKCNQTTRSICFVQNCNASKDQPLYNFPFADKHLLAVWSERVGLSLMYDVDSYLNITLCQSHFHKNCIIEESDRLKPNAIPSLNLIDYSGSPEDCFLETSLEVTPTEEETIMDTTGDRTWGWMRSTEKLGRDAEDDEFKVIPKSDINNEQYTRLTQAAHCMIYADNNVKVFDIYNSRAVILMQLRYDGYFGFPGGLLDSGEDCVSAVNREMAEEMNLNTTIHSVSDEDYVISHWSEKKKLALHFYKLKVTMSQLIEIEKQALLAKDYGSEVLGTVRVPLYTMGDCYRGFPAFLKNNFIGCSREQLLNTLGYLKILTSEEIRLALNKSLILKKIQLIQ